MLNLVVQWTVGGEGRHLVDLDEGRLQLVVDHHVKAEDLEAQGVFDVVGLARSIQVVHVWLSKTHSLNDNIVDFILDSYLC